MEQKIMNVEEWYDKNRALYEQFSKDIEEIITKILRTKKYTVSKYLPSSKRKRKLFK
ncbi:MAG: hypothetical protein K2O59_16795 [Lachnospiraceae bacterium]|nr:hypothetical protein [Lachnospiraceae bacterium]